MKVKDMENKESMKNKEKEFEELKKLAEPLQEWLASHYNPMCSIIIELDQVVVVSKKMGIPTND